LEAKGQRAESLAEADYVHQHMFSPGWVAGMIGGIYVRNGMKEKARKMLDEIDAASKNQYAPPIGAAAIYFALGDKER